MQKSFNAGTDIEDALDALTENKEHFTNSYQKIIDDAKAENEAEKKKLKKDAEDLQKKIKAFLTTFYHIFFTLKHFF